MSKIKVGSTLHDFELPDENGELHRLSELQGDDAMVLMLGRGEHCPRERQHQREMLKFYEWCSVGFTQLVTVLPNDLHDVFKLKISTGAHWTYLADAELEVQTALDIKEYTDPIPRRPVSPDQAGLRPDHRGGEARLEGRSQERHGSSAPVATQPSGRRLVGRLPLHLGVEDNLVHVHADARTANLFRISSAGS